MEDNKNINEMNCFEVVEYITGKIKWNNYFEDYKNISSRLYNKSKLQNIHDKILSEMNIELTIDQIQRMELLFYSIKQTGKTKRGKEFEFLVSKYLEKYNVKHFMKDCRCSPYCDKLGIL